MTRVNIAEAKANLSRLVDAAVAGEEILIGRRNVPLVKLVVVETAKKRPVFGKLKGQVEVGGDFDAPLDDLAEYR